MQSERNALKAGIFIVVSIVLCIAVLIGIKGLGRFLEPMQHAQVRFAMGDDIGGLSPGDEVRVGGAKVGIVRGVDFVNEPDGKQSIAVSFSIPRRFILHKDATVNIQSTVTGVSVLNFSNLGSGKVLASGDLLEGKPAALTQLLNAGPDIMSLVKDVKNVTLPKVNTAIDKTTDTVTAYKTTATTATEFVQNLRGRLDPIVERYYGVADTAKAALTNVSELFGDTKSDFRTTVANLKDATGTVKDKLPGVMDKADGLLAKVTLAIDDARAALTDVKAIASDTRESSATIRQVIVGNRGRLEAMIASLKTTGDNLKAASSEIRRSPWRLLYKPTNGEVANLNLYDSARQFAEGAGQLNEAAVALRDALKNPDVDQAQVQKLVDQLDKSFDEFNGVEEQLWKRVK